MARWRERPTARTASAALGLSLLSSMLGACAGDEAGGCLIDLADSQVAIEYHSDMISVELSNGGLTSHQRASNWASLHSAGNSVTIITGRQPVPETGDWVSDSFSEQCSGTPSAVWTNQYSGEAAISFGGSDRVELRSAEQLGGTTLSIDPFDDEPEPDAAGTEN